MMSSTGEPEYGRSTPAAQQPLFAPQPSDREGYLAASEKALAWSSRRYGNVEEIRALAGQSYDRAYYPAGNGRQFGAMTLAGSRADALRKLTAELVPGAGLLLVLDMGHDRPRELREDLCDAIEAHTRR